MSSNLQGPVLGKRKSIDPGREDQFSEKGEAILVAKDEVGKNKDATFDEKEKDVEPSESSVVESEDCEEDEEEDLEDLRLVLKLLGEHNKKVQEAEEAGLIERPPTKPLRGLCPICLSPDHYTCPWDRGTFSPTVPVVSSHFRVLCKSCGNTKFHIYGSDAFQSCTQCGCSTMCAVRKRCPWCLKCGHLSKEDTDCQWTLENDPLLKFYIKA